MLHEPRPTVFFSGGNEVCLAIAVACLAGLAWRRRRGRAAASGTPWALFAAVGSGLFAMIAFQVRGVSGALTILPWEMAVLLLLAQGIASAGRSIAPVSSRGVMAVLGVSLLPRLVRLDALPARAHPEDVINALWSRYCLRGRAPQIFDVGFYNVPLLRFHFDGLFMQLFGDNLAGAKVASAVRGTLAILFTYLLARRLVGERDAFLAPALLAFHHVFLHYSRTGGHYIDGALAMAAPAALAASALEGGGPGMALLAGTAAGLISQGYFATRAAPVIGLAILGSALLWPAGRRRADVLRQLGAFLIAFALVVGPMAVFYGHHPDKLTTREKDVVGMSVLDLLRPASWPKIRENVATIVRYHSYGYDKDTHYGAAAPYLSPFLWPLLACGVGAWLLSRKGTAMRVLVPWVALAPGVLVLMQEPLARRTLAFLPACALLIAMAPSLLGRLLGPGWARGIVIALVACASVDSLDVAFRRYPRERPIDLLTATGKYLAEDPSREVQLFTIPDLLITDPHVELFAPETKAREIRFSEDIRPGELLVSAIHAPLLPALLEGGGTVSFPWGSSPEWAVGGDLPSTMDVRRAPPAIVRLEKPLPAPDEKGISISLFGAGDRLLCTHRGPLFLFDYRRVLYPEVRHVRISTLVTGSLEGAIRVALRGRNARASLLLDGRDIPTGELVEVGRATSRLDVDFAPGAFLDSYQVEVLAIGGAHCCAAPIAP